MGPQTQKAVGNVWHLYEDCSSPKRLAEFTPLPSCRVVADLSRRTLNLSSAPPSCESYSPGLPRQVGAIAQSVKLCLGRLALRTECLSATGQAGRAGAGRFRPPPGPRTLPGPSRAPMAWAACKGIQRRPLRSLVTERRISVRIRWYIPGQVFVP